MRALPRYVIVVLLLRSPYLGYGIDSLGSKTTNTHAEHQTPSVVEQVVSSTIPRRQQEVECELLPQVNIEKAWNWASKELARATGMIVYQNGVKQFEAYNIENTCPLVCQFALVRSIYQFIARIFFGVSYGGLPTTDFSLYSITKSLAGLAALLLEKQGILSLDDPVSKYIHEWQTNASKSQVTIRELLSLSSGILTTNEEITDLLGSIVGLYVPFHNKEWRYGAQPYQVFSELVKRVSGDGRDVQQYLDDELFSVLDINISFRRSWFPARLPALSSGAKATLSDVATLGLELLRATNGQGLVFDPADMAKLNVPSLNSAYGLSIWLNTEGVNTEYDPIEPFYATCGLEALRMSGLGGQHVLIIPEQQLVVAKSSFTSSENFEFFDFLFEDQPCQCVLSQSSGLVG